MSLDPPARRRRLALLLAALPMLAHGAARSGAGASRVRVVYQINEGIEQAGRTFSHIRNHLDAEPAVAIVVVAFAHGIDFLLDGAKDVHGNPFDAAVAGLTQRGVQFRLCRNTVVARGIDERTINPEASLVASGVAEIASLQAREAYAYLRA